MKVMIIVLRILLMDGALASTGAFECPCLNSSSAQYAAISAAAVAEGLPAAYGLEGCKAYDADVSFRAGCGGASPADYCENPWCYVDLDLCPKKEDLCIAAGGLPGSYTSPYCRTRDYISSDLLGTAALSYETCGSINVYNVSGLTAEVEGHEIQIAVIPAPPWVTETVARASGLKKFGGPSYEFFMEALECIQPNVPTVQVSPVFATQGSRAKFPSSSYTACVHDVAIGNWDICVADLWLTPERNQLATFLPALRSDFFYLVVPKQLEEVTFGTRLIRPFMPFTADGWLGILAFLCGMATLLWFMHFLDNGWQGCEFTVVGFISFQWAIWHDFLLGGGNIEVEKGPIYKLVHLSFAFFTLVALASYTASLASMLVIERGAAGVVANIQEAIEQNYRICAPSALVETFQMVFGDVFVAHSDYMAGPREFYAGNCDAIIMSQDLIDQLYANQIKEKDCEEVNSGSITEEEGRCQKDHQGNERSDCNLIKAGDLIWSIPLSFPVNTRLSHPVSWAFIKAIANGVMSQKIEVNDGLFPKSQCEVEGRTEESGLNLGDLSGMIFISLFVALAGVLMHVGHLVYLRLVPREDEPSAVEPVEEGSKGDNGNSVDAVPAAEPPGPPDVVATLDPDSDHLETSRV